MFNLDNTHQKSNFQTLFSYSEKQNNWQTLAGQKIRLTQDPGTAISQIWESDSCSDSGKNYRSNRNLPVFLLKKWPHRLLLLQNLKSDSRSGPGFSHIFNSGSERKTQNPAGIDSCTPEMSELSNFAIQIQSWIFRTQSKSNHSPKILGNLKSKSKKWKSRPMKTIQTTYCKSFDNSCHHHQCIANSSKKWTKYRFLMTKIAQFYSIGSVQILSWSLNLCSILQAGSNPKSIKFVISRIQYNSSPVQCSTLLHVGSMAKVGPDLDNRIHLL